MRAVRTMGRFVVLTALASSVAAAVRRVRRGAPSHPASARRAPGSLDEWPVVPRRPAG